MAKRSNATTEIGTGLSTFTLATRREIDQSFAPSERPTLRNLKRMGDTDETVGAMMWAVQTTVGQLTWSHKPQDDGEDSTDQRAVDAATFANSVLDDMAHSFSDHVEESMKMLLFGFAPFEILLKQREGDSGKYESRFKDRKWGVHALAYRDILSVSGWKVTDGEITHMQQMAVSTKSDGIPLWKLLHYKLRGDRSNPQGQSLFTNAYRSWWMKRRVQDSEAIGIEREMVGLPIFTMPMEDILMSMPDAEGNRTPEGELAYQRVVAAQHSVTNMRNNEEGGLVLPSDVFMDENDKPTQVKKYDFRVMTSSGQRTIDTRTVVRDYDRAIARVAMMQFLHLGDRSTGSYALSEDQSGLALRSLQFLVSKVIEEWNRKTLILLWEMNGMDKRWLPSLESSPIAENSLAVLGSFIKQMSDSAALLNAEPELRESMIRRLGVKATRKTAPNRPGPKPIAEQPMLPLLESPASPGGDT